MLVSTADFELVLAVDPAQRAGVVEGILITVAWARYGIAYGRVTVDLNERWSHGCVETGLVLESQAGRANVIQMLVEEKLIPQERKTEDANFGGRKRVRLLYHKVLRAMIFSDREARDAGSGGRERIHARAVAEHVAEVKRIRGGEVMVQPQPELIAVLAQSLRRSKQI